MAYEKPEWVPTEGWARCASLRWELRMSRKIVIGRVAQFFGDNYWCALIYGRGERLFKTIREAAEYVERGW